MKWLKRIVVFALIVVGLVLSVLAVPVGRYAVLALEDSSLAEAEQARLQTPPKPVVEPDGGVRCLRGFVTQSGVPAAHVAVTAAPKRPGTSCGCSRGCACAAAIEAAFADETRLATPLVDAIGTTSDATGHFTLCPTSRGDWLVFAEGAQDSIAQREFRWPTFREVELNLSDPVTLTGRVVERSKPLPITGAEVLVVSSTGAPSVRLKTDATGVFASRVPNVALTVLVRAPGYEPRQLDVLPSRLPLAVELEPQMEVEVTVLEDERPVAGATVETMVTRQLLSTNAQGVARFTSLGRSAETFVARRDTKVAVAEHRPPPGLTRPRLTLRLSRGFTLSGTVTNQDAPSTATITIDGSPIGQQVFDTDPSGHFASQPMPPGRITFTVAHDSCTRSSTFAISSNLTTTMELHCDPALRGRVVTRQGKPLPRAQVQAMCGTADATTRADLDGYFSLDVPDGLCSLRALDERVMMLSQRVTAPNHDVLLVVDEGGTICGHVVDEDHTPLREAEIMLINALPSQALVERSRDLKARSVFRTDDQGAFCIGGLSAARYHVVAAPSRNGPEQMATFGAQVVLGPEERVDVGTIVVKPANVLRGTVTDEQGSPIAGASVEPDQGSWKAGVAKAIALASMGEYSAASAQRPLPGHSDALGRFRLAEARDVYELEISAPGYVDRRVAVNRQNDLLIQLTRIPEALVRGRAVSAGQPVQRVLVETYTFESGDGRFEVPVPYTPNGEGTVHLLSPMHHARTVSFTAAPGARAPIDLGDVELDPIVKKRLTVAVTREGGDAVPWAHVSLRSPDNATSVEADANNEGLAEVAREPTETELSVTARGFEPNQQTVGAADEQVTVVLTALSRQLEGVALGLDEQPAAGSTVRLGESRAVVGDDGHFTLENIDHAATQLELQTPQATWGRSVAVDAEHVEVGQLAGGGIVVTVARPGPLLLRLGEHPAMAGTALFDETFDREGEFIAVPIMAPGTTRFTGLTPGRWSVYFWPVTDRGVKALIESVHLSPQTVDVGAGNARVRFD